MAQGGRPRRSEEQPDSPFGEALKEHLRRVKDLTQAELAKESLIPEKTLSQMVKGKRTSGPALRRNLRDIIKVLHRKKALFTLEEANRLITTIPAVSPLDARDPDDAEIIALFDTAGADGEQAADQSNADVTSPHVRAFPGSRDDISASGAVPEPTMRPLPGTPSPASETTAHMGRETKKRLSRYAGPVLVALMAILGMVLLITQSVFSRQTRSMLRSIVLPPVIPAAMALSLLSVPTMQGDASSLPRTYPTWRLSTLTRSLYLFNLSAGTKIPANL